MPNQVTIFAAQYLVYIDALLAAAVIAFALYRAPLPAVLRWAVTIGIAVVLAFLAARVGAAVFNDPRPFTQDHVKPLIAHGADNGFPSDHGLLVAAIVAAVVLLDRRFIGVFVLFGVLVDWARVGAGLHHVADVLGSAVFVLLGLITGHLVGPLIVGWLQPHLPQRFVADNGVPGRDQPLPR